MIAIARSLVFLALIWASGVSAQERFPLEPLDTSSPQATIASFMSVTDALDAAYSAYLEARTPQNARLISQAIRKAERLFDLSAVPPALRRETGGASAVLLADIFNRLPELPMAEIPGGVATPETLPASWRVPLTEIVVARVEGGERDGDFLFSATTVEQLEEFHAAVIGLPPVRATSHENWRLQQIEYSGPAIPARFIAAMPPALQTLVLGTPAWKVIVATFSMALILATAAIVALWISRRDFGDRKALRLALQLAPPALLAVLVSQAHGFGERQLNLSGRFAEFENVAATVVLYLAAAWAAWIAVFLLIEIIIATPLIPEGSYDAHLLRLIARVGSLLAFAGIVVYGANEVGIPALGLVAGLGVGGIALALAAQSTVENLFGGVSIFVDRPFRVGDFILYAGASGTVEQIGPRSTRLRGLDGTITTVPNADLAKMHVTNSSNRDKCLFHHVIGLRYETTTAQLQWLLDELRRRLAAHPLVEDSGGFPRVRFVAFGASAIEVDVRAYVLTQNWSEFLAAQEALLVEIIETVEAAGSGFAFPSQTTYLAQDTGVDAAHSERRAAAMRTAPARPSLEPELAAELGAEATEKL